MPLSTLSRACDSFSPAALLGSGATGEVYRGRLDGAGVALKRLRLPEGAPPAARAGLQRAFNAELSTLSAYRHPRIVRLLSYALDEDPASAHPFVLALELLEEGSVADHLRGPGGEAAAAPPLTPLERIDAALGAAAGLAYLHGLREEAGSSGGGGGEAPATAPAAPVLHRDVKSANIGLTRIGGALYAKVLDCGLARALRGGAGAAAPAGSSLTGGVVGTLGYMAPELATGDYTPRSDIYALGCVLLELLSGARVGPGTAVALESRAIEDGEGVGAIVALAEACWPPPAAGKLAALALACIHHSPKRRAGAMGEVLAALREVRSLVAPAAPLLVLCPVCDELVSEAGGLYCRPELPGRHFCCHGCLQDSVCTRIKTLAVLREGGGNFPCPTTGCGRAWVLEDMEEALDKGTLVKVSVALRRMAIDGPREAAALAAAQAAALAAAARLALGERVAALRRVIVERDLLLRCPHCAAEFDEYDGCNTLACGHCGTGFCAVCLADCGSARATHEHHKAAHGEDFFNRALFERERRARYLARLVKAVRGAGNAEVQRALVAELARADLRDLGISEAEVLEGAARDTIPDVVALFFCCSGIPQMTAFIASCIFIASWAGSFSQLPVSIQCASMSWLCGFLSVFVGVSLMITCGKAAEGVAIFFIFWGGVTSAFVAPISSFIALSEANSETQRYCILVACCSGFMLLFAFMGSLTSKNKGKGTAVADTSSTCSSV